MIVRSGNGSGDIPLPKNQDLDAELASQGTCQEQLFQILQIIVAQLHVATAPHPIAMGNPSLHFLLPPHYDGDSKACHVFLIQCTIHFEVLVYQYISERAKVAFIILLLFG